MILPPFRLHRPATVSEAIDTAGSCGEDFDYVGGGTDLLPNYKNRLNPRRNVIALWGIRELSAVGDDSIGAMTRLARIEEHAGLARRYPGLLEAVRQVASPLVREQATLGGNVMVETRCYYFNQSVDWRASKGYCMKADGDVCLVVPQKEVCYAVYSGDTAAVLMALDASFDLTGPDGTRTVRSRDFFQPDGIRKNVMDRKEILARIAFPEEAELCRSGYEKLRLRDSFDFPDAGVAASLRIEDGVVEDLQIVVNAVSMTPLMFPEVTDPLKGERITADLIDQAASAVAERTQPVRNVMFPPQYRKRIVEVFTRRLLARLAGLPEAAA